MSREWKPGDVAMRTTAPHLDKYEQLTVATTCLKSAHGPGLHWHHVGGGWDPLDAVGPTYRPVVVIDPEDREAVERLLRELHAQRLVDPVGTAFGHTVESAQAALREYANPTPPKPDEPQGLGAVVEDDQGRKWVRVEPDGGQAKWLLSRAPDATDPRFVWSAVPAVRVLSEGWS